MARQIVIDQIVKLKTTKDANGVESKPRYSLRQGTRFHGVYTSKEGETEVLENGAIVAIGGIKIGDTVVIIERELNNPDGTPKMEDDGKTRAKGWYFSAKGNIDDYVAADYEATDEAAMERLKERKEFDRLKRKAELAKTLGEGIDLAALMATA